MGDRKTQTWIMLHPLVAVAVLFIAGLIAGRGGGWAIGWDAGIMGLGLASWSVCEWRKCGRAACVGLVAAVLAGGSGWWHLDQGYVANSHLARMSGDDRQLPVLVRVEVLTDGVVRPRPADLSPYGSPEATTRCAAQVRAVFVDGGWRTCAGTAEVTVLEEVALHRGDVVEIAGMMARPRGPTNPGGFDYKQYLAASQVYLALRAKSAEAVRVVTPGGGTGWLEQFRLTLRGKLLEHTVIEDDDAGNTLVALLLGWRDPAMRNISQTFTDAGAAHLLAISGTHVAVVAGAVWVGLGLLIRRPGWRMAAMMVIVGAYMLATPMGPPVIRAAVAVLIVAAGRLGGRRPRAMNVLAATVLIVLLLRPADMLDAGFQLTFASTACLILLAERTYRWLCGCFMPAGWQTSLQEGWAVRLGRLPLKFILGMLAANIVGAAASMPLVAYHFHQANPWGVLTGMVLLPVVAAVLIAAMVQLIAATVSAWLGGLLAVPVVWVTKWALWLVGVLAHLPLACPGVRPPPVWLVAGFFAVAFLWTLRRDAGVSRATVAVFGAGVLAMAASWYVATQRHDAMHIWALDAGQGACVVIETPQGRHVVINAGSKSRGGLAQTVIEPFLRVEGINRIDAAVLAAATRDDGSALAALLTRYPSPHILCSAEDLRHQDYWWIHAMLGGLRQTGTAPRGLAQGDQFDIADLHGEVLWPMREEDTRARGLVLLLTCAGRRVLVLGGDELPSLASGKLEPVDVVIIDDDVPPPAELVEAVPMHEGGFWVGPVDSDSVLSPRKIGCVHLLLDQHGCRRQENDTHGK